MKFFVGAVGSSDKAFTPNFFLNLRILNAYCNFENTLPVSLMKNQATINLMGTFSKMETGSWVNKTNLTKTPMFHSAVKFPVINGR